MIQRILEAGQRKTFYYVRIRDQGYKLSKLFFLLNRDSCPDHANSVSLIHNLDWNMILETAESAGVEWYVVEHDADVGDPFESFAESLKFLTENFVK